MSKFIFSLGAINKKLIYPIIFIIAYSLIQIYYCFRTDSVVAWYLEGCGNSIGQILSFFVSNAVNYKKQTQKKLKRKIKNIFIDYIFIYLINAFFRVIGLLSYNMFEIKDKENNEVSDISAYLFLNDGLEIISLTLTTHFILKYRYYNHHFISIAVFVVLCVFIDIIFKNFTYLKYYSVIVSIISIVVGTLNSTYLKYLMEFKYYFSLDVLFFSGICFFINIFGTLVLFMFIHKANGSDELTLKFYEFYNEFGLWIMIEHFLLGLIAYGLIASELEFIIFEKLSPIYVFISYQAAKIPSSLVNSEGIYRWLIFIVSVFQIICLLFYLEIFECNFCSLSKNTKRNIEKRSAFEQEKNLLIENDKDSFIIIKGGYDITEMVKKQEVEMEKINNDDEKTEGND